MKKHWKTWKSIRHTKKHQKYQKLLKLRKYCHNTKDMKNRKNIKKYWKYRSGKGGWGKIPRQDIPQGKPQLHWLILLIWLQTPQNSRPWPPSYTTQVFVMISHFCGTNYWSACKNSVLIHLRLITPEMAI